MFKVFIINFELKKKSKYFSVDLQESSAIFWCLFLFPLKKTSNKDNQAIGQKQQLDSAAAPVTQHNTTQHTS